MHTSKKPAMPIVQPHQNKFSPAKCPDKCNELCNNSQCYAICNSKACAYDNLACNEKLPKLVSLFLRCTPQKKPSAMPIVQPHQNKFRVFLLIAQLMVRKLFLGAHFKMPFCWLSSLDVSIHQREIADYLLVHNFNVPRYYHKKPAKKLSKVTNVTEVNSSSYTYFPFFTGLHQNKFSPAKCPDKCNELCSNNSQCDDICNSKACAYDNLDCNEKLPKLVSLFFLIS